MNKLGAQFDWRIADRIMPGKDTSAYAVPGFQDRDFESGVGKFHCGRQSGCASAENNNVGIIGHYVNTLEAPARCGRAGAC